jgi:hypothetical protein
MYYSETFRQTTLHTRKWSDTLMSYRISASKNKRFREKLVTLDKKKLFFDTQTKVGKPNNKFCYFSFIRLGV